LDELEAGARYARERLDLYKAKVYGSRPTSPSRLRELERVCAAAEGRLLLAQSAPAGKIDPAPAAPPGDTEKNLDEVAEAVREHEGATRSALGPASAADDRLYRRMRRVFQR